MKNGIQWMPFFTFFVKEQMRALFKAALVHKDPDDGGDDRGNGIFDQAGDVEYLPAAGRIDKKHEVRYTGIGFKAIPPKKRGSLC